MSPLIAPRSQPLLSAPGPFTTYAADYLAAGFIIVPARGKSPYIPRYNYLTGLGRATINEWASRWPNANIGLGTRRAGLVVLDADDKAAVELFRDVAGETPLRVRTPSGGEHWYFADPHNRFVGVNRPGGALYDIKGAGGGDLVLLPGSWSETRGDYYRLAGDPECHPPTGFAQLRREIPPLSEAAYAELARRTRRCCPVTLPDRPTASVEMLSPSMRVREGERNVQMFLACCREAPGIKATYGPGEAAFGELLSLALVLNETTFEPPLSRAEVAKTARSAWTNTVVGINKPRGRRLQPIRDTMIEFGGHSRATVLLAFLSGRPDAACVELAPQRWAVADVIPGWTRNDYMVATRILLDNGRLKVLRSGGKGRGIVPAYRVVRPLRTPVAADLVLWAVRGEPDVAALLLVLAERWSGATSPIPISVRSMVRTFARPFSNWTERRLRAARTQAIALGLLEPIKQPRRRADLNEPARFWIRVPAVLKMAGTETQKNTPRARLPRSTPEAASGLATADNDATSGHTRGRKEILAGVEAFVTLTSGRRGDVG